MVGRISRTRAYRGADATAQADSVWMRCPYAIRSPIRPDRACLNLISRDTNIMGYVKYVLVGDMSEIVFNTIFVVTSTENSMQERSWKQRGGEEIGIKPIH